MEVIFYIGLVLFVFSMTMIILDYILKKFFDESHYIMRWWRRNVIMGDEDVKIKDDNQ